MIAISRPERAARSRARSRGALDVVGGGAVREVEAHDVDARGEHARQDFGLAAGGAERGDDLGRSGHGQRGAGRGRSAACASSRTRDRRELAAFEELEERAAGGRDVGDAVGDAELVDRGDRVAAARDRERGRRGDRLGERLRAAGERRRTRTRRPGRSTRSCPACATSVSSAATVCGPTSRIRSSSVDVLDRLQLRRARRRRTRFATTASIGHRHLAGELRRGSPSPRRRDRARRATCRCVRRPRG